MPHFGFFFFLGLHRFRMASKIPLSLPHRRCPRCPATAQWAQKNTQEVNKLGTDSKQYSRFTRISRTENHDEC
ncbi:hypothetical protein EDB86DRAFT_553281 [Lactarius hatsudake]|nr:hypothetical protein EDB86DRAFT_553281 [Lactarius hatsudake]